MADSSWLSSAAQYVGAGAETANAFSDIATPALEGAALGAAGGAFAGSPGTGALVGGALGGLGGATGLFSGSSGTTSAGAGPVASGATAAPLSIPMSSPDVTAAVGGGADTGWYNPSVGLSTPTSGGAEGGTGGASGSPGPAPGSTLGGSGGGAQGGGNVPMWTDPNAGSSGGGPTWTDPLFKATPDSKGVPNSILQAWDTGKGMDIAKAVGNNAGSLVTGGGLLAAMAKGNTQYPGQAQMQQTAEQLAAQGTQLSKYLTDGTLPPAVTTALHRAGEAAKATIRSQYAARGQTGSDAEKQDLQNVDLNQVSQGADIATKLLQQGVSETGMSTQLYNTIMQQSMAEDASLGQALTGFAQSLASSGQPITLKVSQ